MIGCPGYNNTAVGSAAYTINSLSQAASPAFSPGAGPYSSAQSVTISTSAPAGYVHDSAWYTGDSDQSTLLDSANGFAHKYYSDTSTLDFHWDWANSSATNGFALAVSFKQ